MKLFFKHLLKSIRRKPAQPFVLVATLTIAVGVCIMSFGLDNCFREERESVETARYGSADITVSLNGTSKSRFMFADDARRILADKAEVAGVYELPILHGIDNSVSFAAAVDFYDIDKVFDFSFTEYGEVKKTELSEIAFISARFADEHGLGVGDVFSAEVLGGEKSYTVAAVSALRYLSSYDIMVDIGGVVDVMAEDSLFVSALGDSFKPSSTLYIDVKDGYDTAECKELLSNNSDYSDKSFLLMADNLETESDIETMMLIVNVARSFAAILSVAVTFCCLYILASERSEENQSFRIAGARALHLNTLQYAEVVLYWLVGSVLGVGLGAGLLKFTVHYARFEYSDATLSFTDALFGILMILAVSLLTATAFIVSAGKTRKAKKGNGFIIIFAVVLVGTLSAFAASFTVRAKDAFPASLIAMMLVFILSFVAATYLLRLLMQALDTLLEKRFNATMHLKFPSFRYALKNVFSVKVLHNFARLISLLVAVVLSCFLVIVSADGYILAANEMIDADYVILNSAESCYQKLVNTDSLESVSKSFLGSASFKDGRYTPAISVDDAEMLSNMLGVSELPTGNKVIFCSGQAVANELKIGDMAELNIDGTFRKVEVAEIIDCGMNVVIFDSEYFGYAGNMILVKGKEGIPEERLMLDISESTALEVATVMTPDKLMGERLSSVSIYLDTGHVLLALAVIFAAIGIVDNLIQSYRERREEFELYKTAGMSGKSILRMKIFEVSISLVFGVLFGFLTFSVASIAISRGLFAYGYDVFEALATLR